MTYPVPTPIYRLVHIENLEILLTGGGLHAPNFVPAENLQYHPIHNAEIQEARHNWKIPIGPGGVMHDYIPFYFGYRPPMLLLLKTNRVQNYSEGQDPIIYLVSSVQDVLRERCEFVFSDGHGLASYTEWYTSLEDLDEVDWEMVNARYWADKPDEDMDRQRRKQAEFLVFRFCPWSLIREIAVLNRYIKDQVDSIMNKYPVPMRRDVHIRPNWYY